MASQHQHDFQRRLHDLEADVQSTSTYTQQEPGQSASPSLPPALQQLWLQGSAWFSRLPPAGKVIVAVIGIILGLSLLNTVLSLVTTAITLALVVGLGYGLYRVFLATRSPH